tara:strand:+ start:381 stop:1010 length:630 start_codon:yes stop_codon:yes gene_type:complete
MSNLNYDIQPLFPIPVYITSIDRKFTKKELQFVNEQKKYCVNNTGNFHTKDTYILNRPEFINIKKFIEEVCQSYLDNVICPKKDIKIYVTQSWLNYTEQNQFHHEHSHDNSFASGVLYFDSDKDTDSIKFLNPNSHRQISPEIDETKYNLWNSNSWFFSVETGQVVMFPSSTIHKVDIKKNSNVRISLAFNTFLKGKIGSNIDLTELIL